MKNRYNNLIIYYFSGTGNSRNCAYWMANKSKEEGVAARVYSIDKDQEPEFPPIKDENTMIGFCAPTHGFNIAPLMLNFILRFPRGKAKDVFVLNTRAGMKIGKIYTPGLSGIALILPALILILKGYRIKALKPVDLPSNWISIHPGIRKTVVESINNHWKGNVESFTKKILQGKRIMRGLLDLPIDILISPVAILYMFIGRYALAKTFFANHNCDQCGLCINNCPVNALKLKHGYPFWKYNCESCMRCMNICPKRAIETSQGVSVFSWWIILGLISSYIIQPLQGQFEGMNPTLFRLLDSVIGFGIGMLAIYILYELLHWLSSIKTIRRILSHLSFTILPVWRRYKIRKRYTDA
jgi:ferredoxin